MYLHPSELRVVNTRRVFREMLAGARADGCSRAELARATGLSAVTAGKVVDELIAMGLLNEPGEARDAETAGPNSRAGGMGRPPRIVRLSAELVIPMVEIGVRRSRVAGLTLAGREAVAETWFTTPRSVAGFVDAVTRARAEAGIDAARAVLVSVPGVFDAESQRILFSPNLRWSEGADLLPALASSWSAPACAVQEIQALALGHQAGGDAPESFVLVDFGDGVGGAVIHGGHLFHAPLPLCGEIGHTGVAGNRRACGCGSVGCLETLVSRTGLLTSYRHARRRPRATWGELEKHVAGAGVEAWLERSIDAAALVIAGAINLLGIGSVVVTGDLPRLHPDVPGALEERINDHALLGRFGRLMCRVAPRRRELGLVAAAADRVLLPEPAMTQMTHTGQRSLSSAG